MSATAIELCIAIVEAHENELKKPSLVEIALAPTARAELAQLREKADNVDLMKQAINDQEMYWKGIVIKQAERIAALEQAVDEARDFAEIVLARTGFDEEYDDARAWLAAHPAPEQPKEGQHESPSES